jgi:SAM-dependent methyltransferase
MERQMDDRSRYWSEYYGKLVEAESLDYSNDKVQAQTFGLALAAAGPILGRRCLDFACGRGRLSMALDALGGEVTGVDFMPEFIAKNTERAPRIRWRAGTLPDAALEAELGSFDLAFALEVLQLVPFAPTLAALWKLVRPGGRVVVLVPTRACPIVQNAMARFEGRYDPPSPADVRAALSSLPDVDAWSQRGMYFQPDQRLAPYDVTSETTTQDWATPPNRLLAVAMKKR